MAGQDDGNVALRPWGTGTTEHDYGLASIILFQSPDKGEEGDDKQAQSVKSNSSEDTVKRIPGVKSMVSIGDASNETGSINNYSAKILEGIPLQSLQDQEIAMLRLEQNDAGEKNYYGVFNNFSLVGVQEASEESIKLHVNFSEFWNLFFFGEKPKIYQFNGHFLDSKEFPYYQEFMTAYKKYLSGRKSVENKMEMVISYQGKFISGYLISVSVASTANTEFLKQFSFSVVVKDEGWSRNNYFMARTAENKIKYSVGVINTLDNRYRFPQSEFQSSNNNISGSNNSAINYNPATQDEASV